MLDGELARELDGVVQMSDGEVRSWGLTRGSARNEGG
jgi:hypothetical protein